MSKIAKQLLLANAILIMVLCIGCRNNTISSELKGPDYSDNYSNIWEPKNYKQWGPYNVHDPSWIKAGDYYYL